jgi:hypothetical protein
MSVAPVQLIAPNLRVTRDSSVLIGLGSVRGIFCLKIKMSMKIKMNIK